MCYEREKDKIIIYDETNSYKKFNKIEIKTNDIKRIIGLQNKYLMIEKEEEFVIFWIKNDNYEIWQKIKTDSEGYEQQYNIIYHGCTHREKN